MRLLLIVLAIASSGVAHGSTILPMSVKQMSDSAGQVIEGVIVAVESEWTPDGRSMVSTVRFEQVKYHKGRTPGSQDVFELVVPGGRMGDVSLSLTGAPDFKIGQRWILFLHPNYRVHPVVGLYHGAFRIEKRDGGVTVLNAAGRALRGFDYEGKILAGLPEHDAERSVDQGLHLGAVSKATLSVTRVMTPKTAAAGISYGEFMQVLEPVLRASKDHVLTGPAGRRLPHAPALGVPLRVRRGAAGEAETSRANTIHPALERRYRR